MSDELFVPEDFAVVRSWGRADRAALDPVLYDAVRAGLKRDWPFDSIEYASRT